MKKKLTLIILGLVFVLGLGTACSNNANTDQAAKTRIVKKHKKAKRRKSKKMAVKIKIKIDDQTLNASLNDTSAGKAFAKKLPETLTFVGFPGSNPEKMADLGYSLSTKGMPTGEAGAKGTIGYWSPDKRLIFYYGHVDYFPGIHIIGKFTSKNYVNVVENMKDHTKVTITKIK
ncbi:cyclophilin-like fold protein [Lactobacillus sp. HT06-2]|uniref:cyclophilin-like fold protein n=1 Tax=Lactobacillus sp. HT06-2 TaxID=2080222 RepID=UPI000CD86BC4|nr:cyclophilin-like fold protein [Lactobacillus sp. HT06-2]